MLFSVLYRAGIVADNVTGGIQFETPKNEGLKRQAFSKEVMAAILEKMDSTTQTGLRDRALFELIYSSGLRVSEAANLLVKDVSFPRREMIVRGKFGRDRIVPISKIARNYLVLYLDTRIHDTDTPVFQGVYRNQGLKPGSISRHFSDLLKNYGIKKEGLSAHSIRHASAS
ncbi:MAG: tyrosine-type recombinase/integrase, partial [Treponema sp.]|nr:tyrosine-type recombinase/integrase [Treponema sp.]